MSKPQEPDLLSALKDETFSFLVKTLLLSLMDLVLFSLYVALMGMLSFLIALLTQLHTQARRGELRNTPDMPIDIEKLRDFKATILPLVVALVLAIVAFIIVFLLPPPPPCTNPTVCNYLMSIM